MQHLRLILPERCASVALELLRAEPTVTNVVVLPGAAVEPRGDLVLCDVAREAASDVLERLRALGIEADGSIAMESVDLSLSSAARTAARKAPGFGVDAVVWEQVEASTSEESSLSGTYLSFMVVATLIAGFGVLLDSPVLIVGAMVVGPEFGAVAGICVGIVQRRRREVARSAVALLVGFAVGMVVTALAMLALDRLGIADRGDLDRARPLTAFVRSPDALSFVIAFLAGVAGTLSLTSAKSGALVGVLISVTTIPAAADTSLSVAFGRSAEARGSMLQLLINIGSLLLAGVLTLLVQKAVWSRTGRRRGHGHGPGSGERAAGEVSKHVREPGAGPAS